MSDELPKFVACCNECEEIHYYGTGNTADEAFKNFINSDDFYCYCEYSLSDLVEDVDVYIYTVVSPDDSGFPGDEIEDHWQWVLHKKVETRTAKTPDIED